MWIRQGVEARRTRNEGRVRALLALREERRQRRAMAGKARIALEQADTTQENEWAQVPESTQRIYEAKGRLLEAIVELNRIGQIAFDGDAVTRARFNKDILLRGRKQKPTPDAV